MNREFKDEFDPISFEDFEKALNAVPEGGQIEFSELMNNFQNKNGGKPMYLDIPSYIHNTKWPSTLSGKLVTKDGKTFPNVEALLDCQVRWMLGIYESSHKTRNCIIPPTFRLEHLA